MRIVIDTNIWVSYFLTSDRTFIHTIEALLRNETILYSSEIIEELTDTLQKEKFSSYIDTEKLSDFLFYLINFGERVDITEQVVASRDPRDDKFLSLAVSGHADCILTGDEDLRALHPFRGIPILREPEFRKQHPLG